MGTLTLKVVQITWAGQQYLN